MRRMFVVFAFIALYACNRLPKKSVEIKDFPHIVFLEGDSISIFDNELGIMELNDAGDYILCSSHRTDYHYSVFHKKDFHKVGEILKQGRGTEEFIAPSYFSQYQIEGGETKIWVLERALNVFFKINLTATLEMDSLIVEKKYKLATSGSSYRDMYYINNDMFWATEDQQECRHLIINSDNCDKKYIEPAVPFPKRGNIHHISQTISTKHPAIFKIASAYFNFPQIDFIDKQGIYRTIFYPSIIYPRKVSEDQVEYEYFSSICSDENNVYALYDPSHDASSDKSEILVFSWEGEAICKYIIPFANAIFVDATNKKLYALHPGKEQFNTTCYKLQKL